MATKCGSVIGIALILDGPGGYQIGYATSSNGLNWSRSDTPDELLPGKYPWANQMTAYPSVVRVGNRQIIFFFNGDGFGRSGIACATLQD